MDNNTTEQTEKITPANLVSKIQTSITNFIENKKRERLLKIQTETTKQQWGEGELFKQGEKSKVSNVAFKKPEIKKEPILK